MMLGPRFCVKEGAGSLLGNIRGDIRLASRMKMGEEINGTLTNYIEMISQMYKGVNNGEKKNDSHGNFPRRLGGEWVCLLSASFLTWTQVNQLKCTHDVPLLTCFD